MLGPGSMGAASPDEGDRQKGAQTVHPLPEGLFYDLGRHLGRQKARYTKILELF